MAYWAMLASRSAFRKGNASYCGHSNPVAPGMWAGGIVGLKSILGVRSRAKALQILGELSSLGFLKYSLDSQTKKLTYEITDWVVKCSGAECMSGTVYASTGYGFLCLPRSITQRLVAAKRVFDEADAWLDLWCHTTYEDYGNAFSFLAPVVQYGRFGSVLTLETLGERLEPDLVCMGVEVLNDAGILRAGETADVKVVLRNLGRSLEGCNYRVSSTDANVLIK